MSVRALTTDEIGLPAKSGVSGVIISVIPNVLGLATFSPRLDKFGNSVRWIIGLPADASPHWPPA
jgi:glutaminase